MWEICIFVQNLLEILSVCRKIATSIRRLFFNLHDAAGIRLHLNYTVSQKTCLLYTSDAADE